MWSSRVVARSIAKMRLQGGRVRHHEAAPTHARGFSSPCGRGDAEGLAVQKLNAGVAEGLGSGGTDAPLRGGRTGLSNARVDAARGAQHGAAMIAEGLKVVCVQRVDEGHIVESALGHPARRPNPRPPRDFGNSVDHEKSVRPFKGIFCRDISEFESYMPSQPVRSPPPNMGRPQKTAWYRGISQISLGLRVRSWVTAAPCSTGRQRMPHSEKLAVRPRRIYEEPGRSDDELLAFDNVILTPHLAGHHVLMDSETSKI